LAPGGSANAPRYGSWSIFGKPTSGHAPGLALALIDRRCLFCPLGLPNIDHTGLMVGGLSDLLSKAAKAGVFKDLDFFLDHWKENQIKIMKQKK